MSASQVHAVIAAGLKDPDLLTRWKQDPDMLRRCGVEPKDVDLEALWKFAALTTKVRHNGLRAEIPATFRLLNVAGMEIEVFGAYTNFHAGKEFGSSVQARSNDLLAFLGPWLDFEKREHALLWDLIRHELALARLHSIIKDPEVPNQDRSALAQRTLPLRGKEGANAHRRDAENTEGAPTRGFRKTRNGSLRGSYVPCVCGEIILHEMRSDPRTTEMRLRQKTPQLEGVPLDSIYFCYWRLNVDDVYVLELDALSFYILSTIDGNRSVAELGDLLNVTSKGILNSLKELEAVGVITFEAATV